MLYGLLKLAVASAVLVVPAVAAAQSARDQGSKSYGTRVSDRGQNGGSDKELDETRTNRRLESRIRSRLNTRIDRFVSPQTDFGASYKPKADDTTKD